MQITLHIAIINVNLNALRKLLFPVKISMKLRIPIKETCEDTPFQSVNEYPILITNGIIMTMRKIIDAGPKNKRCSHKAGRLKDFFLFIIKLFLPHPYRQTPVTNST